VSEAEFIQDEGPPAGARARGRRCLVRRESLPRERLVRFVVAPDGQVVPDIAARLPGRGLWLSAERGAISSAVAKGLFAKAARRGVHIAPDLADRIEAMLVRRCQDIVGLARRAGELVVGFDQVADWLRRSRAEVLVTARDGAPDGRRKLRGLARELPMVMLLDRHELGAAVGRDEVVHMALAHGGLARKLLAEAARLRGFRTEGGADGEPAAEAEEEPVRS
jgi:predicted RNA-binding protein YlxR (DUF448 family)/ribosomal protein L30E